ncbi:MAG: hypothetical protein ACFFD7_01965 [Candidatus Thorarchaeota archaeon]
MTMNLDKQYVEYEGEKYFVDNINKLYIPDDARNLGEIQGLNKLINLETLVIPTNCLRDLNGIESLVNLKELLAPANQISNLKALTKLTTNKVLMV